MITLESVSKHYKQNKQVLSAVNNVSLSINQGEIFGLMGYSGAGKSTLLRLINLLEHPDEGKVFVADQELTQLPIGQLRQARQKIGMVFQHFNLMANRTVADNIGFALKVAGTPAAKIAQRVKECLDIVGLSDRADHYPAQLSGGQKQRVGIARALAPNPKVILADEPTSALDPLTTRSVLDCLQNINQEFGVTVVIVTHEIAVLEKLCHRTALLNHGKLVETLPVVNGKLQPSSELGKSLIQEAL
ncbi:methionine ABC transporter ATP-binding protein [Celerinatantimonas sp. MCCC 1A17872]|uniref:methionine ABC transporter ATP-binding protein n=1 Tax=Celerinatantimonas sp. MCCC 1A17872 TaxID=3177514 RepID=UPI0038BFE6E0